MGSGIQKSEFMADPLCVQQERLDLQWRKSLPCDARPRAASLEKIGGCPQQAFWSWFNVEGSYVTRSYDWMVHLKCVSFQHPVQTNKQQLGANCWGGGCLWWVVKYRVRLNMFFITLLKIGKDHFYNFKCSDGRFQYYSDYTDSLDLSS